LRIFHQKFSVILKEYFHKFSYAQPFGYDNSSNDGTIKFLVKIGAISPSSQKQGHEVKNPITGY